LYSTSTTIISVGMIVIRFSGGWIDRGAGIVGIVAGIYNEISCKKEAVKKTLLVGMVVNVSDCEKSGDRSKRGISGLCNCGSQYLSLRTIWISPSRHLLMREGVMEILNYWQKYCLLAKQ